MKSWSGQWSQVDDAYDGLEHRLKVGDDNDWWSAGDDCGNDAYDGDGDDDDGNEDDDNALHNGFNTGDDIDGNCDDTQQI